MNWKKIEKENYKCSTKDHIDIDAKIFCNICKVYLCDKCQNFHSKIFVDHQVHNLTKENKNFLSNICKEKNHSNKLKYFCKTHNKLCCAACITKIKDEENGQHKDCEICLLIDLRPKEEKKFIKNFTKLEEKFNSLDRTIEQLKEVYEDITKKKENLIMEIQNVFTKLRSSLNEREDLLIAEVETQYNKNFFGEEFFGEIEQLPGKIKKCLEYGSKIKDKMDEEKDLNNIINYSVEFKNYLKKIKEINIKINKCNLNNEIIYCVNNNKNFEKHIKECVYIKPKRNKKHESSEESSEKKEYKKKQKNEKSEISSNELSEEESEKNIHKKKKKNVKNR